MGLYSNRRKGSVHRINVGAGCGGRRSELGIPRGATRAEIPYALAEINWKSLEKSVGNHGTLARNQKSGP